VTPCVRVNGCAWLCMSVLRWIFGLHGRSASLRETTPLDRRRRVLFFLTPPPKTGLDSLDSTISLGRRARRCQPFPTLFVDGLEADMCPASCIAYWLKAAGLTKSSLLQMASYLSGLASLQGAHRGKRGADPEEEGAQGNEEL